MGEFLRYENDTDWQEMSGPDLVDVDPEKWFRSILKEALSKGAEIERGKYKDSYEGKLWSMAIQKAMEAPFPEVALQYLLNKVEQKSRAETLEELLSMKHEAINEREAISPMGILNRTADQDTPPFTDENVRRLQYVKVWDIEKMLKELTTPNNQIDV